MNAVVSLLRRVLIIVVLVEVAYVLLVNGALQLQLTQDIVNKIRPDKFHVSWESAWTAYPFRIHAQGISANGQSRSQQWQVDASSVSGTVSVLPLIAKQVYLRNIDAADVDYRQRPRLKADKDYSANLEHFPDIEGRDIVPADTTPRKNKRPWKLHIDNATASGRHSYWIMNFKGSGEGSLVADLDFETRGGPLGMAFSEIDLHFAPAYINSEAQLFSGGLVSGSVGFAPFVPKQNKGVAMLRFLEMDVDIDLDSRSLAFINLFTANLSDVAINGTGNIEGHVNFSRGYVLAGTDLTANAADLNVTVKEMEILGEGEVRIKTPPEDDQPLSLGIDYSSLAVRRLADEDAFLQGDSMKLVYNGTNYVVPTPGLKFEEFMDDEEYRERRKNNTLKVEIDDATLLDMAIINDYLPEAGALRFSSGAARLQADVFAEVANIEGQIELQSEGLKMDLDGQALEGELDVNLVLGGGVPREMRVDLSGSTLRLDEVRVEGEHGDFDGDYWSTDVLLSNTEAVLMQPLELTTDIQLEMSDSRPLVAVFDNAGDPPGWVSKLLLMEDINGEAALEVANDNLTVPYGQLLSDKAEVATKLMLTPQERHAAIFARYKKLKVLLKVAGEDRDIELRSAREKFDEYRLPN